MAIKKRPSPDLGREARIEAFGASVDGPAGEHGSGTPDDIADRGGGPVSASGKADLKPMLIRFESWEHALLREVAALDGRSMHNMVKTLLIPALQAIKAARRD